MATCRLHPPRTGCRLVLAAHMDDETLGLGASIAAWRMRNEVVHLAFLTQGQPRDPRYLAVGEPAEFYAERRRAEACQAARILGVRRAHLHFADYPDLELSLHIAPAWRWLNRLVKKIQPCAVYAPAYEGGHPDHDALNFLASHLRALTPRVSLWEFPLYTQAGGRVVYSRFFSGSGVVHAFQPGAAARQRKRRALACYVTQRATLQYFPLTPEPRRRLPRHDFTRPPVSPTVYELWGWPWRSGELAAIWSRFQPNAA